MYMASDQYAIVTMYVRFTFSDIRLQICCDLENRVKVPSRSLKNVTIQYSAYDFLLMFYSNYGSILCRFWDIQCRKISWPWNPSQEPIKVIKSGTIRWNVYGFLLVFFSNFVPKFLRY